jgi:hypothetical protein
MVSFYPSCETCGAKTSQRSNPVDIRFIAEEPDVPLLVLLGDKDTIAPLKESNCEKMLDRPWHPQKMLARESRNVTHAQFQPHARPRGIRLAPVFARSA